MRKKLFVLFLIMLFMTALIAPVNIAHASSIVPARQPVYALRDSTSGGVPTDFWTFLVYLGTPASVSLILSLLTVLWPAFKTQDDQVKMIISLLIGLLGSIVGYLLQKDIPTTAIDQIQPFWFLVANFINALLTTVVFQAKMYNPARQLRLLKQFEELKAMRSHLGIGIKKAA